MDFVATVVDAAPRSASPLVVAEATDVAGITRVTVKGDDVLRLRARVHTDLVLVIPGFGPRAASTTRRYYKEDTTVPGVSVFMLPRSYARDNVVVPGHYPPPLPPVSTAETALSLRDYQKTVVDRVVTTFTRRSGVLVVGCCGSGKTVCAIAVVLACGARTAVLVHSRKLQDQWIARITHFAPTTKVHAHRSGVPVPPDADVVLFMVQTISKCPMNNPCVCGFGLLIADECHHMPASTFCAAVSRFDAVRRLGLTATPERRDGLHKMLPHILGPVVVTVKRRVSRLTVVRWLLPRRVGRPPEHTFAGMQRCIANDTQRNHSIAGAVEVAVAAGHGVVVLCNLRVHVSRLVKVIGSHMTSDWVTNLGPGHGDVAAQTRVVVSTYMFASEGWDPPVGDVEFTTVVLAAPRSGKNTGALRQIVGRVQRGSGARALAIDMCDTTPGLAANMGRSRSWFWREYDNTVVRSKADLERVYQ